MISTNIRKAGEKVVNEEMGMTNKQFQGFIRSLLALIKNALKSGDKADLEEIKNILQDMLEDGD